MSHSQLCELQKAFDPSLWIRSPPERLDDGTILVNMHQGGARFGEVGIQTDGTPRMGCGCLDMIPDLQLCSHACWIILWFSGHPDTRMFQDPPMLWDAIRRAAEALMTGQAWQDHCSLSDGTWIGDIDDSQRWWAPYHDDTCLGANDECPICLDGHGTIPWVQCTACPRIFHRACAERWTNGCPMCRH